MFIWMRTNYNSCSWCSKVSLTFSPLVEIGQCLQISIFLTSQSVVPNICISLFFSLGYIFSHQLHLFYFSFEDGILGLIKNVFQNSTQLLFVTFKKNSTTKPISNGKTSIINNRKSKIFNILEIVMASK